MEQDTGYLWESPLYQWLDAKNTEPPFVVTPSSISKDLVDSQFLSAAVSSWQTAFSVWFLVCKLR